jgi:hypothetical protein
MNGFMKEQRYNFQSISKFVGTIQLSFLFHALARLMSERCSCISTHHGNTKSETHGVSFKLFSRSIKKKRLSSDLVLFTLIKVFEENV